MINSINLAGFVAFAPETKLLQEEYQITKLVLKVPNGQINDTYIIKCWNKAAEKAAKFNPNNYISLRGNILTA